MGEIGRWLSFQLGDFRFHVNFQGCARFFNTKNLLLDMDLLYCHCLDFWEQFIWTLSSTDLQNLYYLEWSIYKYIHTSEVEHGPWKRDHFERKIVFGSLHFRVYIYTYILKIGWCNWWDMTHLNTTVYPGFLSIAQSPNHNVSPSKEALSASLCLVLMAMLAQELFGFRLWNLVRNMWDSKSARGH